MNKPSLALSSRLMQATALASLFAASPAFADSLWNGGPSEADYSLANKWMPNGVPGSSDTALIETGILRVSADWSIHRLKLDGGTVLISSGVSLTSSDSHLTSGTLSGGSLNGPISKYGSGTATMSDISVNGGALLSAGTLEAGSGFMLNGRLIFANGTFETSANLVMASPVLASQNARINTSTGNLALSGVVSGTGGLIKTGAAILSLTASNTYSGITTIYGGILAANSSAALGNASATNSLIFSGGTLRADGVITFGGVRKYSMLGAGTIDTNNFAVTLSNGGSGSGKLTKIGQGMLAMAGTNTTTGGIDLTAGELHLTDTNAAGSGAINVTGGHISFGDRARNDAEIRVDSNTFQIAVSQGRTATQGGAITELQGPRPFEKIGEGKLMLAGDNTFTGGTTVTAGTLEIGDGGSTGSLQGNVAVAQNATFGFNRSGALSFDGIISGDGTLTHTGTGRTTLTREHTFTGGTTVTAGTLDVSNGARLLNRTSVSGAGTLVVNGGADEVVVGSGGTLMGTGNVGPVTIMSGGTLAPGNSIGTMIVHKSLTFEPGSTYRVELSPADSDRVAVGRSGGTGIATLTGATVMASYDPGSYVSKKYTIIAADGGLAGTTFAGLKGSAPKGFSHKLGYDSNKAYIELDLDQVSTAASSGGASSVATGLPMNLQAAYAAIREYFNRVGQLPASFGALASDDLQKLSTGTAVPQSATQFAGAFVGAMSGGLISAGSPSPATPVASLAFADDGAEKAKADRISRRFEAGFPTAAAQPAASRYETWGSVIGSGQYLAANPTVGTVDVSAATFGVASGTDIVAGATRVGVAFGAAWSNSTLGNGAGTARVGSGSVGLRAHHDFGRFYLSGATAYGLHFASSARNFGGDVYSADFTSQSLSGRIEAGAPIGSAVATFTPYGAFQATSVWTGAYTERASGGGIFALAYQPGNTTELASELGLRAEKKVGNTTFSGGLGWTHYFSRGGNSTVGFATLPGTTFTTQGVAGPSDTAIVSLGVSHAFSSKLTVGASAHGEFGSGFSSLAGKANLKWNW